MTFRLELFLLGIAVIGATILFLISVQRPPEPVIDKTLNVIVYVCDDGDQEICVVNADGTSFRKLTSNASEDYRPAINKNGVIAYLCNQQLGTASGSDSQRVGLCSIKSDGSSFANLTANQYAINYSEYPIINNLDEIFYICFDDELEVEICVVNADGTGSKILTDNDWTEFSLSTNSLTKLAFICVPAKSASFFGTEICEMNRDGSGFRQQTQNTLIEWGTAINDSGLILSNCDRDLLSHLGLCLINPPNGRFIQLSAATTANSYSLNNRGQIVFQCQDDHDSEICLIRPDGSGLLQLTDNEVDDKLPSISDSGVVAYLCGPELCVIKADGTGQTRLSGPGALRPVADMRLFIK